MFVDWVGLTGWSKLTIDLITIPIFSAVAGLLTNWTGVLMLFWPVEFRGVRIPGLRFTYPYMPRRVQIVPVFDQDGRFGLRGFIPARAQKMASICVDKAILRIGSPSSFIHELDPDSIADHVAVAMRPDVRRIIDDVLQREYAELWATVPPQVKSALYQRVEADLPAASRRAFTALGENMDDLIDIKQFVIRYLDRNSEILEDMIRGVAASELRFMVRIGLLGFPLGILLALALHYYHDVPVLGAVPAWLIVIAGASLIGVVVNVIAIKMVFEPGEPAPRYRYLWRQALLAKRQPEAAADLARLLAYQVVTPANVAEELLHGPNSDKTLQLMDRLIEDELRHVLGPTTGMVRAAVGPQRLAAITAGTSAGAAGLAPTMVEDAEFTRQQAVKIEKFAGQKLSEMSPGEFMEMFYAAVEQDAWLLYLHGGALGIAVGAAHLLFFGA